MMPERSVVLKSVKEAIHNKTRAIFVIADWTPSTSDKVDCSLYGPLLKELGIDGKKRLFINTREVEMWKDYHLNPSGKNWIALDGDREMINTVVLGSETVKGIYLWYQNFEQPWWYNNRLAIIVDPDLENSNDFSASMVSEEQLAEIAEIFGGMEIAGFKKPNKKEYLDSLSRKEFL